MTAYDTLLNALIAIGIEFTTVSDTENNYVQIRYTGSSIQGDTSAYSQYVFNKDAGDFVVVENLFN